ncbi:MAG: HAMP domain-containing sensor histidine kinase [Lachnospiraceae bacterium]|nr:HAMP domain-containing sensor histidine kinase [Lachnospiraceae bacterium]
MLKNREIQGMLLLSLLLLLLSLTLLWLTPLPPLVLLLLLWGSLNGVFLVYTRRRYRKIGELTEYLFRLQTQTRALDIRDNAEGELSILKNEIYKLSEKLLRQTELLQEDKRFLAKSLSDISHQLKTPLTSLLMMVELLSEEGLPEEKRREFLENVRSGLERMEWLVLSLLKLSRLDADAVEFQREPLDAYELLLEAAAPISYLPEAKGVRLLLEPSEEPVTLLGDRQWLSEALGNLLKNCMEHTPEGGSVTLTYGGNNLYTELRIADTGEGIAPDDLPHIFERFYRGKNSGSQSVGIGLALAREIVSRQKGKITVESAPGKGTAFTVRIYR